MTGFNEWYKNIEKEYPLYQDKDGYNIGNTRALQVGWKAALEFVLKNFDGKTDMLTLGLEIQHELSTNQTNNGSDQSTPDH